MDKELKETLNQRHETHGPWKNYSEVAQYLKNILYDFGGNLNPIHKEGLDMIMGKVARILTGDPNFTDHWHDIAGYASVVEKEIIKNGK